MKLALTLGLTLLVGVASVNADTVAYWNFNDQTQLGSPPSGSLWRLNPLGTAGAETEYSKDSGVASSAKISVWGTGGGTLVGTNGTSSTSPTHTFGSYSGNLLNAQDGALAGGTLSVLGFNNNDKYFLVKFSDKIGDGSLSFAYRATSTGVSTITIDYSTNGGASFTNLSTQTLTRDGVWYTSTANLGNVFASTSGSDMNVLKLTLSGIGGTSTNGNVRIDNMLVTGTIVPEPMTLAMLALGAIPMIRRRK